MIVLGLALSVFFLAWAFRDVSLAELAHQLRRANYVYFALAVLVLTLTFPLRALRWRILLAPGTAGAPLGPVWRATAIGFMANNVLPARAGEVVRAYAASQLVGLPVSTTLASIGIERVFDGLVIIFLLTLGILAPEFPSHSQVAGRSVADIAVWTGGAFAVILMLFVTMVHAPARALQVVDRAFHRVLPRRAAEWTVRVLRNLIEGLAILRSPRDTARVLVWSFALWLTNASGYWFGFRAFHLLGLPASSTLVLQGIVALGVAIPSSPGWFGPFEAASRASLELYGVNGGAAASFALGLHIGGFIPITAIGFWILARTGLTLRELSGKAPKR